ncbi:hypothetical protein BC936DRAFT_142344 [Jimgerdemannia flammicorona]|uniref:C2H2-type domain-containing protein n=1 Tax=Jimgerdemannia flammicorona TaxID=994334 RepID=A0A433DF91_9FUNG|nr:hypothetical protein BC936DRAFT_142344 [Jimgerdemannia flammicorona]
MDSSRHAYCLPCRREFRDRNALSQHNNSPVHRGKTFSCPFCSLQSNTVGGIAQHIENGRCPESPFTRKDIPKVVRAVEVLAGTKNLVTRPLITNGSTSGASASLSSPRVIVFDSELSWNGNLYQCKLCDKQFRTPTALSRHLGSPVHGSAIVVDSDIAWNGHAYECYVCNRQLFSSKALEQHLNSPAHDANEFWCRKCNRDFKLISALIHHFEAEVCSAGSNIARKVIKYITY